MAVYEYRCPQCDAGWEERRTMSEAHTAAHCPHCGVQAQRQVSTFTANVLPRFNPQTLTSSNRRHSATCTCCAPKRS